MTTTSTPPLNPRLFTVAQAAKELSCSARTVWRLLGLGELERVNVLTSVRVTRESVEKFIEKGGVA